MKLSKLLPVVLLLVSPTYNVLAVTNVERVSLDFDASPNTNANGESLQGAVSADGRYVAFESSAFDLIASDTNSARDIFVYDRQTGTNTRVSVTSAGGEANGASTFADMSDDGQFVVFASLATNLTTDTDTNGTTDIFVRDTVNNTTTLISTAGGTITAGLGLAANGSSTKPVISANGNFIAYESESSDISSGDADTLSDIYRYNFVSNTTTLVSLNENEIKGNAKSVEAAISDDGLLVAFASDASNLGGPLSDMVRDVFLRDINNGSTTAVTTGSTDITGFTDSQQPALNQDGSLVLFESFSRNLVGNDTNGVQDVFLYDVQAATYTRMSVSTAGAQGDARSGHPGISTDGRYIVFESSASNLDVNDTNAVLDVFLRDRALGTTTRISLDINDNEGAAFSQKPRISPNGRFIIFSSLSPLVADDTQSPQIEDAYLFQRPLHAAHDQDGDDKSDILWRNTTSGVNWNHLMDGTTLATSAFLSNRSTEWVAAGMGDFNNDGKDDVIWRNTSNGINEVDLLNGTSITSTIVISQVTDQNVQIVGVGDFNDDGYDDLYWRDSSNGVNVMHLLTIINGIVTIQNATVSFIADQQYKVVGVGDFDGDGKDDILWRNMTTGINWIHMHDGHDIHTSQGTSVITDQNWQVGGIGDFDGDAKEDIFWRKSSTGLNWIHLLDGASIIGSAGLNIIADANWKVAQTGDYNGDDKADIFLRHDLTGRNWMYLMDGISITGSQETPSITDTDYGVVDKD